MIKNYSLFIVFVQFGMETLLSDSIVWLWGLDWSVNNDDISRYFQQEIQNENKHFILTFSYKFYVL